MNAQQVPKPYDKFYFKKNIIFLCFMGTKTTKIKSFFTYFKSYKFLGVTVVIVCVIWTV
jgi:hypothetical protein